MASHDSTAGQRPMRTKRRTIRTHAMVVAAVGLAMLALVYARLSGARVPATPITAGAMLDTARDSLLVTDKEYQGWKWFHVYCFRCHGEDAIGGVNPAAPDLRWALSPTGANFPRDSFVITALNGRPAKGMPAWKVMLDTFAIQELYQYVKARSDGWLKAGRPHRLSDLPPKSP